MAFPFIFQSGFENRATPFGWDSETDTANKLDVVHASVLARFPWPNAAPYRGGSCLRIVNAGTDDATLTEGDIDIADGSTAFFRFYIYFAPNFAFTGDDVVNILELQQADGTIEFSVGFDFDVDDGSITIGAGDGTAPSAFGATLIQRDRWYCVEVRAKPHTTDEGEIQVWLDGVSQVSLTTLDQAAGVAQGVLGIQNPASTTTGTILIDDFVMDDLRLYPRADRYHESVELTLTEQLFIGPGSLDNVSLMSGAGTDCVVTVYDTARGDVNDVSKKVIELKNTANSELVDPAGTPVSVVRGAYITLAGTTPRALAKIKHAAGYGSSAAVRWAASRASQAVPGEGL